MRTRVVASIAMAALVLLGTTACNFIAPQATLKQYNPSDGVGTSIGTVKVLNVLVLSEDGEEGSLLANVVNQGTKSVQLKLQYESGGTKVDKRVTVGAGDTQSIGSEDGLKIIFDDIDTAPGELLPVFVQYGDVTGKQLLVPVLDGTLPEYAGLLP